MPTQSHAFIFDASAPVALKFKQLGAGILRAEAHGRAFVVQQKSQVGRGGSKTPNEFEATVRTLRSNIVQEALIFNTSAAARQWLGERADARRLSLDRKAAAGTAAALGLPLRTGVRP